MVPEIAPIRITDLMLVGLIAGLILTRKIGYEIIIPPIDSVITSFGIFLIPIFVFPALGTLVQGYSLTYLTSGIRFVQWFTFLIIALNLSINDNLRFHDFFVVMYLSIAFHTGFSVLQYIDYHSVAGLFTDKNYFDVIISAHYSRVTGFHDSPIIAGQFASLVTLLCLPYLLSRRHYIHLFFFVVAAGFIILFSQTRAALVTFIVGILLFAIFSPEIRFKNTIVYGLPSLLALSVVVGTVNIIPSRVMELLDVLSRGPQAISSLQVRLSYWEQGIDMYRTYGFWGTLVNANALKGTLTDNYYLQLFVQAGPLGPLTLVMLLISIMARPTLKFNDEREHLQIGLRIFACCLAIGLLVHNLFPLPPIQIPLWTAVGIAYGLSYSRDMSAHVSNSSPSNVP
ncbi:O-antigen ligase family protein [Halorarum salinum]|uniref:O-antigen ligase family protein n=1 Tax=Halorarum salinum TaxID=2743089 RepID=A0A7D5L9S8_9EURY|nr:O-antigen ligase family protein [Halobaculum salinum]QLG61089.1 O-antigen ligase family protein [Halobaculum salinum]